MRQASTVGWGQGPLWEGESQWTRPWPGASSISEVDGERQAVYTSETQVAWVAGAAGGGGTRVLWAGDSLWQACSQEPSFLCGRRLLWVGGAHGAPGEAVQGSCAHTIFAWRSCRSSAASLIGTTSLSWSVLAPWVGLGPWRAGPVSSATAQYLPAQGEAASLVCPVGCLPLVLGRGRCGQCAAGAWGVCGLGRRFRAPSLSLLPQPWVSCLTTECLSLLPGLSLPSSWPASLGRGMQSLPGTPG